MALNESGIERILDAMNEHPVPVDGRDPVPVIAQLVTDLAKAWKGPLTDALIAVDLGADRQDTVEGYRKILTRQSPPATIGTLCFYYDEYGTEGPGSYKRLGEALFLSGNPGGPMIERDLEEMETDTGVREDAYRPTDARVPSRFLTALSSEVALTFTGKRPELSMFQEEVCERIQELYGRLMVAHVGQELADVILAGAEERHVTYGFTGEEMGVAGRVTRQGWEPLQEPA